MPCIESAVELSQRHRVFCTWSTSHGSKENHQFKYITVTLSGDVSNTCAFVSIDTYAAYKRNSLIKSRENTHQTILQKLKYLMVVPLYTNFPCTRFSSGLPPVLGTSLTQVPDQGGYYCRTLKANKKTLVIHLSIRKASRSLLPWLSPHNRDLLCSNNLLFWQVSLSLNIPVV